MDKHTRANNRVRQLKVERRIQRGGRLVEGWRTNSDEGVMMDVRS